MASVFRLFLRIPPTSRSFTERKTTIDRNIVYTHAMAEASVAVNTPAPVPTIMIIRVIIGRMPRSRTLMPSPLATPSPLGKL